MRALRVLRTITVSMKDAIVERWYSGPARGKYCIIIASRVTIGKDRRLAHIDADGEFEYKIGD